MGVTQGYSGLNGIVVAMGKNLAILISDLVDFGIHFGTLRRD